MIWSHFPGPKRRYICHPMVHKIIRSSKSSEKKCNFLHEAARLVEKFSPAAAALVPEGNPSHSVLPGSSRCACLSCHDHILQKRISYTQPKVRIWIQNIQNLGIILSFPLSFLNKIPPELLSAERFTTHA